MGIPAQSRLAPRMDRKLKELPMRPDGYFNFLKPFGESIRRAETMILLERAADAMHVPEILRVIVGSKAIVKIGPYPFYEEPLVITEEHAVKLAETVADVSTYYPFNAPSLCIFHPDFALQWRSGNEMWGVLFCLDCDQIMIFGPGLEVYEDLAEAGSREIHLLLGPYKPILLSMDEPAPPIPEPVTVPYTPTPASRLVILIYTLLFAFISMAFGFLGKGNLVIPTILAGSLSAASLICSVWGSDDLCHALTLDVFRE